jgi:hypothetical protein
VTRIDDATLRAAALTRFKPLAKQRAEAGTEQQPAAAEG